MNIKYIYKLSVRYPEIPVIRENVLNKFIDRKSNIGEPRYPVLGFWMVPGLSYYGQWYKRFTVTSEYPCPFVTLETWKKFDPVNFRKDLWDRYWPIFPIPSNSPRSLCES